MMVPGHSGDERLRAAFLERSAGVGASAACPDPERIWAAVRHESRPAERRRIALHAVACPACTEAFRVARDIAAGALPAPETGPEGETPPSLAAWWPRRLSLAAAGAIAVALVFFASAQWPRSGTTLPPPAYREGPAETIRSLLPHGQAVARDECVLRWTGIEGARYDVEVATMDLLFLARAEALHVNEYTVPPEALAGLPASSRLVWRVEAVLPDGRRMKSEAFVSEIE
jgi:hypothetical protein